MLMAKNSDVKARAIKMVEGLPIHGEVRTKPLIGGTEMILLEIHYPPGAGAPLHTHQHETLCYVVKGKVKVVIGDESYTLEEGDACRHPKDVLHSIEGVEEATVLEIKSPAQPIEQFLGLSE